MKAAEAAFKNSASRVGGRKRIRNAVGRTSGRKACLHAAWNVLQEAWAEYAAMQNNLSSLAGPFVDQRWTNGDYDIQKLSFI
jgi:hypothetical protein